MKRIIRDLLRLARGGLFLALGAVLFWRALVYANPVDATIVGADVVRDSGAGVGDDGCDGRASGWGF